VKRAVVVAIALASTLAGAQTPLDLGRELFHGQRAWSVAPQLPGGVALPTDAAACARCHGARGEGAREGGVTVPALRGRPADALLRAASDGTTADGRRLQAPMPRYAFAPDESQALGAYLAQLGSADDLAAGVDARTVQLATLVPRSGAMRAAADHAVRAMQSQFVHLNAAGGAYDRQVHLQIIEFEPGAAQLPEALTKLLQQRKVFALVGSLVGPVPEAWSRTLATQQTPMLANLLPASQAPATPWVTHLLPPLAEQLKLAAAELKQRCGEVWLVQAAQREAMAATLAVPAERVITDGAVPNEARCVLSLLPPAQHAQLRSTLRRPATLGAVAMLSGPAPQDISPGLVELSVSPQLPASKDTGGVWPALGDLAARVAVEALSRSGRDLHAAAFRRAVESMTGYEPLPGVALQYSPHQRAGLALASHWRPSP
jgi:mono/diheme cytochrome c family protein